MPHWLFPSMYPTWQRDENGNIVLLRIPKGLALDPPNPQYNPNTSKIRRAPRTGWLSPSPESIGSTDERYSRHQLPIDVPASFLSLPNEIRHMILEYLPPVDRVCLALTCKTLCSIVVAAPRLNPQSWACFLPRPAGPSSEDYYLLISPSSYYACQMPESYTLLQRLAHGWIPKDKLRYCWKCHRILPRDPDYWQRRLRANKKPKWDIRTSCEKADWSRMSTSKRFQHLIQVWCKASFEDSSILSCDGCREELYADESVTGTTLPPKSSSDTKQPAVQGTATELQTIHVDAIENGLNRPDPTYHPSTYGINHNQHNSNAGTVLSPAAGTPTLTTAVVKQKQPQPRYTVECPACLERQLTFTFRLPRRAVFRTFLRKCWDLFWKYTWKAAWLIGTILVAIISILWHIGKWSCLGVIKAYQGIQSILTFTR